MPDPIVNARMPSKDVALLKTVCRDRGEDVSDFVRRAVLTELARLSFLTKNQKKALGISTQPSETNSSTI